MFVDESLAPMWESAEGTFNAHQLEVWVEAGPTTPERVVLYCTGCEFQLFLRQYEAEQLATVLHRLASLNLDVGSRPTV